MWREALKYLIHPFFRHQFACLAASTVLVVGAFYIAQYVFGVDHVHAALIALGAGGILSFLTFLVVFAIGGPAKGDNMLFAAYSIAGGSGSVAGVFTWAQHSLPQAGFIIPFGLCMLALFTSMGVHIGQRELKNKVGPAIFVLAYVPLMTGVGVVLIAGYHNPLVGIGIPLVFLSSMLNWAGLVSQLKAMRRFKTQPWPNKAGLGLA
jgi:hypothetical protein